MRATWELIAGGFRRHSRYRLAILTSMLANIVFGMIRASLLVAAIETAGVEVAGYDRMTAITYVWVGQALIGPIDIWGSSATEIGVRIKQGGFVTDLLRPTHPLVQWLCQDLGRAASQIVPRFIPMLMVGALLTGLVLPVHPGRWLMFLVSLVLAVLLTHTVWVMVNLLALWVVEVRGYWLAAMVVINLMSGFLIPVQWFPGWLRWIADHSPFPSMYQAPIDMLTGLARGREAITLATQLGWTLVILVAAWWMLARGARKVEVQGG